MMFEAVMGQLNENGEALLSWCALNSPAVRNTMFEKKNTSTPGSIREANSGTALTTS